MAEQFANEGAKSGYYNRQLAGHLSDLGVPVDDNLGKLLSKTDFASSDDRRSLLSELRETPEGRELIAELYDEDIGIRSIEGAHKRIVQAALFPDDCGK